MNLMFQPFKRYADFQGRARRKEYWLFYLFIVVVVLAFVFGAGILSALGRPNPTTGDRSVVGSLLLGLWGLCYLLFGLAVIIPHLAVGVRRLHDTNRSGWWLFIGLVPLVGAVVLLIFFVTAGNRGANRFGPDPISGNGDMVETFA